VAPLGAPWRAGPRFIEPPEPPVFTPLHCSALHCLMKCSDSFCLEFMCLISLYSPCVCVSVCMELQCVPARNCITVTQRMILKAFWERWRRFYSAYSACRWVSVIADVDYTRAVLLVIVSLWACSSALCSKTFECFWMFCSPSVIAELLVSYAYICFN